MLKSVSFSPETESVDIYGNKSREYTKIWDGVNPRIRNFIKIIELIQNKDFKEVNRIIYSMEIFELNLLEKKLINLVERIKENKKEKTLVIPTFSYLQVGEEMGILLNGLILHIEKVKQKIGYSLFKVNHYQKFY